MKNIKHKNKLRFGSALEDGKAHNNEHASWSRRSFLRNIGIAGSMSMMMGKMPVTALANSPLGKALLNNEGDRILVLIRLKGGNDGLNTIIPVFDYGTYQSYRPQLRVPQNEIITLNDEFGMHPQMNALDNMWQDGMMKVVNSVGYPDQNLSHFRSTDIWSSASDSSENDASGWMGRFLETQYPDFVTNPPDTPPAIQIGGAGNIMFNNSDLTNMGVIVSNPDQLYEIAQTGQLYNPLDVPECYYGEQLTYLRTVANSVFTYAETIAESYNNATNSVNYTTSLGDQLALVARLIKGGLETQLYMVNIDGFDTHANQIDDHANLLNNVSEAVASFFQDLEASDDAKRVLGMTFSEFGRRIEENASEGTDHGAAAPMMLFGEGLNGNGFLGANPDLEDLDPVGNLKHDVDFRSVYATVLEQWLCLDPTVVDEVLGQDFERLELGLECNAVSTYNPGVQNIGLKLAYDQGQVRINYSLPESMPVTVRVFDVLGRPVKTLFEGYQTLGNHQHIFESRQARLSAGIYVVSVQAGRQVFSQKMKAGF
jgi:uncharacterized protein (DUF1501 family)